jgi:hypothetical protein
MFDVLGDARYVAEISVSCNLFFHRCGIYSAGVWGSKVVLRS